ncbi:AMIN domain-containing protein [Actinomyces radicidentis]|uniref:AMIN-like domain-containing (lipo)protein n=1 Tax=Actinomyces radicidentis TaxID=111015 RepID=UPI0028EB47B1|nr:AMIN domain-containing protein [Actinomyces radicidentis]
MRRQRSTFHPSPAIRRAAALSAATALSLGLAACGGGGSASSSAAPTGSGATTAAATAAGSSSAAGSAAATSAGSTEASSGTPAPLTKADDAAAATSAPTDDEVWGGLGAVQGMDPQGSDSAGVETDLRFGRHDGYDRIVVETSGEGTLGYRAEFVDEAATLGKGDAISLTGGAYLLQVIGTNTQMPVTEDLQKVAYTDLGVHDVDGTWTKQVYLDGTFEDQFQVVIATDARQYRVTTLTNPTRLVIDLRDPS